MMIGLDTSGVDGRRTCDWKKARAAGARFVYLKKSQHTRQDTCYARDSEDAREAGLVVGAYHFPAFGLSAATPKAQVAAFKGGPGAIVPHTDLPPVLDVEIKNGLWTASGRSKSGCVEVIREFVLEMRDQFGCWPMIYTSYNQWDSLGLPKASWAVSCPLWIKTAYRLRARQPVDQVIPPTPHLGYDALHDKRNHHRIPDPWAQTGWWCQQFQGDATGFPGISKTVDMNRFNVARIGARGPHVAWMQRKFALPLDGIFDGVLDSTVRVLQAERGLDVDGIVGPVTFAAISWRT